MPVTSVSGPPNLKVSRYVVSRQGTPRFFLMRSTTSPAVIRMVSNTDRPRRYAGLALRGRTSSASWRRRSMPGSSDTTRPTRIRPFFSAGEHLVPHVLDRLPLAHFAGDDDIHVRQHLQRRLNGRRAGQQPDTLHHGSGIADDTDPASRPQRVLHVGSPARRA